jgi:hypothetical protein
MVPSYLAERSSRECITSLPSSVVCYKLSRPHPSAVEVAKKRGADFAESDLPEVKPNTKRKHAPTHWAAFTFSGVRW